MSIQIHHRCALQEHTRIKELLGEHIPAPGEAKHKLSVMVKKGGVEVFKHACVCFCMTACLEL